MKFHKNYFIKKTFFIIIILVLIVLILFGVYFLNSTNIYSGIKVNDVDVGGLSIDNAIELLKNRFENNLSSNNLKLTYLSYSYDITYKELGVSFDYYGAIREVYKIGREGSIFKRIIDIINLKKYGLNYSMKLVYNKQKLYSVIYSVGKDINIEEKNAQIKYENGKFEITPEINGQRINYKELEYKTLKSLYTGEVVNIPVDIVKPEITKEKLKNIDTRLALFITYYNKSNTSRANNIRLSTQAINGKVLLDEEVFSFNGITGCRDEEAGYKKANVIIKGELISSIGGGVCQVSSTVYNAALLSGMEIVERYNHSMPVNYIAKGRDATVSYGYLDFKFKNTSGYPVYINANAQNGRLIVQMFGNKENLSKQIKINSHVTERVEPKIETIIDHSLKGGQRKIEQQGTYGYKVETYKLVYNGDKLIEKILISKDYYKPKNRIIKIAPQETND